MLRSLFVFLLLCCCLGAAPPAVQRNVRQPGRSVPAYGPLDHMPPGTEQWSTIPGFQMNPGYQAKRAETPAEAKQRKAAAVRRYRAERAQWQRARSREMSTHDSYIQQAQEAVRQVQGR